MKDGGPAFPQGESYDTTDYVGHVTNHRKGALKPGMSLRDWFAGRAMQGIVSALHAGIRPVDVPAMVQDAYELADAMIAEKLKRESSAKHTPTDKA